MHVTSAIGKFRYGIIKTNDYSVHSPQKSHTFIPIEWTPAFATTSPVPFVNVGAVQLINAEGSISKVVALVYQTSSLELEKQ